MLRLLCILLIVLLALARGGSLRNLAAIRLRWVSLAIAGLVLQLLIFTPFRATPLISAATPAIYLVSMLLLVIWVALNWRIPGMLLMAAGLLMNTAAIVANGGYMPVAPESAAYAGRAAAYSADAQPRANNSIATDENVRLWLLTDIIPVPSEVPFANVFSIGDIVLTAGVGLLCYRTIRPPRSEATQAPLPGAADPISPAPIAALSRASLPEERSSDDV